MRGFKCGAGNRGGARLHYHSRMKPIHTTLNRSHLLVAAVAAVLMPCVTWAQESMSAASAPTGKAADERAPVAAAPEVVQKDDRWMKVKGTLGPWRRSLPAAEDAGRVASMGFEVGDTVKDGAVLVQLDDTIQKLEVARAEAALEAGRLHAEERAVEVERAERELSRVQAANEAGKASEGELDGARLAAAAARSLLGQARAEQLALDASLRASRRRLDRLSIKAPFTGVVVGRHTELGGWLNPGESVAEIMDVNTMEVRVVIPEALLYKVKENESRVRASVPLAEVGIELPVVRVLREVDPSGRTFSAWIKVENKDGRLVPGLGVECQLLTGGAVEVQAPAEVQAKDVKAKDPASVTKPGVGKAK